LSRIRNKHNTGKMKRSRGEDRDGVEDSYDLIEETLKTSSYQKDQYEKLLKICQQKLDHICNTEFETSLKEALSNVTKDSFYEDVARYSGKVDKSIKNNEDLTEEILQFLHSFEVIVANTKDRIDTYQITTLTIEGRSTGKTLKFEWEHKNCGGGGSYYFGEFYGNGRRLGLEAILKMVKFKHIKRDNFIAILDFMFRSAFPEFEEASFAHIEYF